MTISPEEEESETEDDGEDAERKGIVGERIRAEKETDGVKEMLDPRKPTLKEVENHYRTHLPYRNWCPHCVRAKGKDLDHRRAVEGVRGLPEFSFDYCFPGDELGYKLTVLVGRERTTGMSMATVLPSKGSTGKFAVDKALEFIAECGSQSGDIIIDAPEAGDRVPRQRHRVGKRG